MKSWAIYQHKETRAVRVYGIDRPLTDDLNEVYIGQTPIMWKGDAERWALWFVAGPGQLAT